MERKTQQIPVERETYLLLQVLDVAVQGNNRHRGAAGSSVGEINFSMVMAKALIVRKIEIDSKPAGLQLRCRRVCKLRAPSMASRAWAYRLLSRVCLIGMSRSFHTDKSSTLNDMTGWCSCCIRRCWVGFSGHDRVTDVHVETKVRGARGQIVEVGVNWGIGSRDGASVVRRGHCCGVGRWVDNNGVMKTRPRGGPWVIVCSNSVRLLDRQAAQCQELLDQLLVRHWLQAENNTLSRKETRIISNKPA